MSVTLVLIGLLYLILTVLSLSSPLKCTTGFLASGNLPRLVDLLIAFFLSSLSFDI